MTMPDGAPAQWRNVITSEVLSAGHALPVGDALLHFPVALLMGEGKEEGPKPCEHCHDDTGRQMLHRPCTREAPPIRFAFHLAE